MKMDYEPRERGRQRKYHETIALLTYRHEKGVWRPALDKQMEEYYEEKYPEYFGRFSKSKSAANKRAANKARAQRTMREAMQREIRKNRTANNEDVHHPGLEPIDFQTRRERRASS
jgi:hypothetical protein